MSSLNELSEKIDFGTEVTVAAGLLLLPGPDEGAIAFSAIKGAFKGSTYLYKNGKLFKVVGDKLQEVTGKTLDKLLDTLDDFGTELGRKLGRNTRNSKAGNVVCDVANAPSKGPLWTPTKNKSGVENAFGHFEKHGAEFPEYPNATQYAQGARNFVTSPPQGTLTKVRPNGDKLFYDPATNTFAVQRSDGALRTMFRPTDGINYWNLQ